jgi:hypothetical protein
LGTALNLLLLGLPLLRRSQLPLFARQLLLKGLFALLQFGPALGLLLGAALGFLPYTRRIGRRSGRIPAALMVLGRRGCNATRNEKNHRGHRGKHIFAAGSSTHGMNSLFSIA